MAIVSDILIVDDDPVNVQIIANALVKTNCVRIATSGLKGVEVAQEIVPDLILLDIGLPDISGYEVCKMLKSYSITRHIPIVFIPHLIRTLMSYMGLNLVRLTIFANRFLQLSFALE